MAASTRYWQARLYTCVLGVAGAAPCALQRGAGRFGVDRDRILHELPTAQEWFGVGGGVLKLAGRPKLDPHARNPAHLEFSVQPDRPLRCDSYGQVRGVLQAEFPCLNCVVVNPIGILPIRSGRRSQRALENSSSGKLAHHR